MTFSGVFERPALMVRRYPATRIMAYGRTIIDLGELVQPVHRIVSVSAFLCRLPGVIAIQEP